MGGAFPEFTVPVKVAYQDDGAAKTSFLAAVDSIVTPSERRFKQFAEEAKRSLTSIGTGIGGDLRFDLNVPQLRQAASEAALAAEKMTTLRDAAISLAQRTGDTSRETQTYLQSLRAQTIEAERAKSIAEAQVTTYERLRREINRVAEDQMRLRDAYRATYAEQARSENAAFKAQGIINERVSPTLSGARATDNGAGFRALEEMARYTEQAGALRSTLDPTIALQRRFDDELAKAATLFSAGAINAREYASAQALAKQNLQTGWTALTRANEATERYSKANQSLADSQRGVRIAGIGAGQQLQDIAISLQGGQRASLVFAQQLPQLGFALSALDGNANKTLARVGALGTTLAGPWGLAVIGATMLAGPFIDRLFGMGEASEKAERQSRRFADVLDFQKKSTQELTEAIKDQLAAAEKSLQTEYQAAKAAERTAQGNLDKAIATREATKATLEAVKIAQAGQIEIPGVTDGLSGAMLAKRGLDLESTIKDQQTNIDNLKTVQRIRDSVIAKLDVAAGNDPEIARQRKYEEDVRKLTAFRNAHTEMFKGAKDEAALYRTELDKLADARDRDIKAIQAQKQAERSTGRDTREKAGFISPIAGASITSGFGPRARPTAGASSFHPAIDLAAPIGTPVRAPQVGTVTAIGFDRGLGKFVVLDHGGGTTTRFGHLSDNTVVSKGQRVEQGDVIGKVGNTGISTGPHLDYQVKVNGRPVDPRKGLFPIDPTRSAEVAQAAQKILEDFGRNSAASIQRLTDQFDEQPRLIDQVARSTKDLDDLMAALATRKPEGFKQMIKDAELAKVLVGDAVDRQIKDGGKDSRDRLMIQDLLLSGQEREATIVQAELQAKRQFGNLDAERLAAVRQIAAAEYDHLEAVKRVQEAQAAYLDASRSVRQEIEGMFSGQKANFGNVFKQLNGRILTEQLFGDMFRDLDQWMQRNTGLGRATTEFTDSTSAAARALQGFSETLLNVTRSIAPNTSISSRSSYAANDNALGAASDIGLVIESVARMVAGNSPGKVAADGTIEVSGRRTPDVPMRIKAEPNTLMAMSPDVYFSQLGRSIGDRLGSDLGNLVGPKLGASLGDILGRTIYGNAVGGLPGAALGGIQGLAGGLGLKGVDYKRLGDAVSGAGTGTMIAGLSNALGLKMSGTGAQIGGAIGGATMIPGLDIIGSIAGGIIGKLFGGNKYGSASISNTGVGISGNNKDGKSGASSAGDGVSSAIKNIVDRLGAEMGSYAVSIGLTNNKWNVNPNAISGMIGTTKQRDTIDFKEDQAAAVEWAIRNAIEDGAVKGLSALENAILRKQTDIDKAVEQVLSVQDMRKRYKQWKDPIGAALDELDTEFTKYRDLLTEFGGSTQDFNQALELYSHERDEIVKAERQKVTQTLQSLYNDLRMGDNGLSLRDRLGAARSTYDPLKARVQAGDTSAFDEFAEAGRTVRDLMRELYGSQSEYFGFFDELTSISKAALDAQQVAIDAAAGRNNPFSESSVAKAELSSQQAMTERQTQVLSDAINAQGGATNANLGVVVQELQLIRQALSNDGPSLLKAVGSGGNF